MCSVCVRFARVRRKWPVVGLRTPFLMGWSALMSQCAMQFVRGWCGRWMVCIVMQWKRAMGSSEVVELVELGVELCFCDGVELTSRVGEDCA